jgi:hypothetical protein
MADVQQKQFWVTCPNKTFPLDLLNNPTHLLDTDNEHVQKLDVRAALKAVNFNGANHEAVVEMVLECVHAKSLDPYDFQHPIPLAEAVLSVLGVDEKTVPEFSLEHIQKGMARQKTEGVLLKDVLEKNRVHGPLVAKKRHVMLQCQDHVVKWILDQALVWSENGAGEFRVTFKPNDILQAAKKKTMAIDVDRLEVTLPLPGALLRGFVHDVSMLVGVDTGIWTTSRVPDHATGPVFLDVGWGSTFV